MNKEQIETIIENLAKSGYKFQSEKTEDGSILTIVKFYLALKLIHCHYVLYE